MPAYPSQWIQVSSPLAHGDSCPDYRLNVHYTREQLASKLSDQPIDPLKVLARAPVGNSNVNMIRKPNAILQSAQYDLGRQETIRPLKHQQKTGIGCLLKLEEIWKIDIRIQHH